MRSVSGSGDAGPLPYRNQLEPGALIRRFEACPPEGFAALRLAQGVPGFVAEFDLLTTAEPALKQRLQGLPLYRWWSRLLRVRTAFVGTTVSEYALLPAAGNPGELARGLRKSLGRRFRLTVLKDLPQGSPLLDEAANAHAERLAAACTEQGFVLLEGQALAYVAIDFASIDEYLARLSAARRKDIRRKLRKREELDVRAVATGAAFADEARIDECYALYLNVYAQSEIHFDRLSREFFASVLRDAQSGGIVFEYRHADRLIGYNLCFVHDGKLIDKYVGFRYPEARDCNLYFISWLVNLEYALAHGLSHYVAGWTDPQIKAYLGASFTFTRHAVYVRNPLLRRLARRFGGYLEGDRQWSENRDALPDRP